MAPNPAGLAPGRGQVWAGWVGVGRLREEEVIQRGRRGESERVRASRLSPQTSLHT